MTAATAPIFTFTFRPPTAADQHGFFAHRSPVTWLDDLARVAGVKVGAIVEGDVEGDVTVIGSEDALRFACVAFNLHAEQTPWDSTPVEQAEALEAVLLTSG